VERQEDTSFGEVTALTVATLARLRNATITNYDICFYMGLSLVKVKPMQRLQSIYLDYNSVMTKIREYPSPKAFYIGPSYSEQ